ncbi:MAG TPA: DNA primase [Bacteroidia bacterium]|jgi:DNA primase|nr:DNA primase [Bacteroidia bacterium]
MIPKETISTIFEAARIDEVVGEFVSLKKRGANMIGLCPFHNEKTPSFNVSPVKGIYKCFGCGKAGNSVNFIMEHEQLSYPEALRWLAKKYNIEIEEQEQTPEQVIANNERESLYVVCSFAQKNFTENLWDTDEGKSVGLSYFRERGFSDKTIEKFQLGFSFDQWRGFSDAAIKAGHKLEYLVKAGLTISKEEDPPQASAGSPQQPRFFDRFSARVIFPVHNVSGRVIAFGGRTLKTDKKVAKYINSPETDIYHKSKVLYGLYFAKKRISEDDNCFLVEGYTDVISMHQAGIENVVASSGTALTVDQIRLIRRYTNNITILFDGDSAGIKASFRGIDLILEEGMNVRVLLFPDGEDPDSFSKRVSGEELKTFIKENSKDFIAFKAQLLYSESAHDPIKKAGLIKDMVESISLIPEPIYRSVYIKECSRIMDVDEQALLSELNKLRRKKQYDKPQQENREQQDEHSFSVPSELLSLPDGEKVSPKITESDAEHQEKDLIRVMMNYGKEKIDIETETESGEKEVVEVSVSEYVVHEVHGDNIEFENPVYRKLFQEFILKEDEIPDTNYFIQHPDPEISKATVEIISTPYSLANWDKHDIEVITEGSKGELKKSVCHAIYALKIRKIEKMIHDNQKRLKESGNYEEQLILVQEQQLLVQAKKSFAALLGRVILK